MNGATTINDWVVPRPTPNPVVLQMVDTYTRSLPDIHSSEQHGDISELGESQLVQPLAESKLVYSTGSRDYYQWGAYLGRVTVDEGRITSLES